jgi:hypothetical protein
MRPAAAAQHGAVSGNISANLLSPMAQNNYFALVMGLPQAQEHVLNTSKSSSKGFEGFNSNKLRPFSAVPNTFGIKKRNSHISNRAAHFPPSRQSTAASN